MINDDDEDDHGDDDHDDDDYLTADDNLTMTMLMIKHFGSSRDDAYHLAQMVQCRTVPKMSFVRQVRSSLLLLLAWKKQEPNYWN